jgi:hypothetical protein
VAWRAFDNGVRGSGRDGREARRGELAGVSESSRRIDGQAAEGRGWELGRRSINTSRSEGVKLSKFRRHSAFYAVRCTVDLSCWYADAAHIGKVYERFCC